ncbi:MAG: hypothetical protein NVSMB42_26240 [Herpetosiphon sp.]
MMSEKLTTSGVRGLLPARPADSNKGTFGKVLVVAGSGNYPGAAFLTASGALRSGAGLVTLAVGRSLFGALAASVHEATFLPLPEEDWGVLGSGAANEIRSNLDGYKVLVVGPGLGQEDDTKTFLKRLFGIEHAKTSAHVGFIKAAAAKQDRHATSSVGFGRSHSPVPDKGHVSPVKANPELAVLPQLVLDADALNILAEIDDWHQHLTPRSVILTPHPGEMARLLHLENAQAIHGSREDHARQAADRWGQIVVLKGAQTVIASPDGEVMIGPEGNAALATAGTGDVLAGLIGGFVAQGVELFAAAQLGVWIHAAAGQHVRDEMGDMGTVASDLLVRIPHALQGLRRG